MQILHHPHPHPHPHLHSLSYLNAVYPLSLLPKLSSLSLRRPITTTTIRMGGGPRTYPGGVSKWQWKRMQSKKAKQLLKARLARERQIYEMRKRAELKAAIADLERPWELVQRATPKSALFSVGADEQLKVLADRFQKPGGFDLWSEDDGPQLFETPDGLPTARFFPKGVVHSVKPYGRVVNGGRQLEEGQGEGDGSEEESGGVDDGSLDGVVSRNWRGRRNGIGRNSSGGSQSGGLGGGKFASDTEESDGEDPFDSSVNLDSRVGNGFWNGPNVRSLARGKQRGSFRHSGDVDGSLSGVVRNKRGGRNGMNLRSHTRDGKLGNGSIARESDENSDFSGTKPSYGGRNERYHRVVNNLRVSGTRIDGNGPKLKDLGGRQTSSNMRNNGRQWSTRGGNRERFRRSHSEDAYDMSLQRDRSYGFSAKHEDAKLSPESRRLSHLGGRQTSSNTRNNGRQWSSRGGNRERFRRSHSEDAYDMSLQRDGSYGFSAKHEDAELSSESTSTR